MFTFNIVFAAYEVNAINILKEKVFNGYTEINYLCFCTEIKNTKENYQNIYMLHIKHIVKNDL